MPVTRSQAGSVQSTDPVSSPGVNTPRCIPRNNFPGLSQDSRQDYAVVPDSVYDGAPFEEGANGNPEMQYDLDISNNNVNFSINKCGAGKCKTCEYFVASNTYFSNHSKREHKIINHTGEDLSCKSQNIVYLLTCTTCNLQYVGETAQPLHLRINQHRSSKLGCERFIEHFKTTCPKKFNIQIIVKMEGTGYNSQGQIDEHQLVKRQNMEDSAIKSLRTIYPYGLNIRAKDRVTSDDVVNVGTLFPPLPRKGPSARRERGNRNNREENLTKEVFFEKLKTFMTGDLKNSFYNIRILLNKIKKKTLRSIYKYIILEKASLFKFDIFHQWYDFVCDVIDCKLYRPPIIKKDKKSPKFVCVVDFINKGMDSIGLSKIINKHDVFEKLPDKIKSQESKICVTYKLRNPIRNKIFNYKETIASISVHDPPSLTTCSCDESEFKDPDHGHVVTGDLRIVEDVKLRKLLSKGPNYREPRTINYNKCKSEIFKSLDHFITVLIERYKLDIQDLNDWRTAIITALDDKINHLKSFVKPKAVKPVLKNDVSLSCLEKLQQQFVLVPIDKASNNIAFICKYFYIRRILDEVGVTSLPSNTYKKCDKDIQSIIENNIQICDKFRLKVEERCETLPIMYWMPKMHKKPSGARFIVASSKCSTKPLSKTISYIFKLIFEQVQNFHLKSKFYTNKLFLGSKIHSQ